MKNLDGYIAIGLGLAFLIGLPYIQRFAKPLICWLTGKDPKDL